MPYADTVRLYRPTGRQLAVLLDDNARRADDRLPARFLEEAVPLFGFECNPETGSLRQSPEPIGYAQIYDFEAMLDRYYQLRGWSSDGVPTPATLRRLGLDEYVEESE